MLLQIRFQSIKYFLLAKKIPLFFFFFFIKSLEATTLMILSPGQFSTDLYKFRNLMFLGFEKNVLEVSVAAWTMATWLFHQF